MDFTLRTQHRGYEPLSEDKGARHAEDDPGLTSAHPYLGTTGSHSSRGGNEALCRYQDGSSLRHRACKPERLSTKLTMAWNRWPDFYYQQLRSQRRVFSLSITCRSGANTANQFTAIVEHSPRIIASSTIHSFRYTNNPVGQKAHKTSDTNCTRHVTGDEKRKEINHHVKKVMVIHVALKYQLPRPAREQT